MTRLTKFYLFGVTGMLALLLTGCDLAQLNPIGKDIAPVASPAAAAVQAAQNDSTIVRVQPATQQLNVGDMGNLQIWIDNVSNLFGAEISVQFDPRFIQIQDTDPATDGVQIQPGNFPAPNLTPVKLANNTTGVITYVVTQTAPTPPAAGSGAAATITFQAIGQGVSNLTFITAKLSDPNGQQIPVTVQSGQVTVTPSGQPTATITATLTLTSTPNQPTPTLIPVVVTATLTPTVTPVVATATPTPIPLPPSPTITPIPQMNIPSGATVGFCYRVQAGETLPSIAQKFGVTPGFINLVNDLNPPGYVFLHQALFIPQQSYGKGPNVYIVQSGDTLTRIADDCHLPLSFLAFVNHLSEEAVLPPGHVLAIPLPPFAPPSRYAYPGSMSPPLLPPQR
jgi:LysM repeat protein